MSTPNLVSTVLGYATGAKSHIHGEGHWAGVAAAGHTLCKMTPEADPLVVLLFSVCHDAMRENDGHDPEHGARAAALAHQLREEGLFTLSDERMELLERALIHHDRGGVSEDPTIGACWDADRLTLWRLNRQPDPALLSTPAARRLTSKLASQAYGLYRFRWDALFLNYDHLTSGAVHRDLIGGSPYKQLDGEDVYLRFGDLPEDGRSYVIAFAKLGQEWGTSVYQGVRCEDGYHIDLRRGVCGLDTRFTRSLLCLGRPLYVVQGRHVGVGGGGEPLLDGAEIACEVSSEAFAGFVPERWFLRDASEFWRAKRAGKPAGSYDFMYAVEPEERQLWPRQSEAPRVDFAAEVEKRKREMLKRWGLLEDYEKSQRRSVPRPAPAGPFDQSFNDTPWKEATWT